MALALTPAPAAAMLEMLFSNEERLEFCYLIWCSSAVGRFESMAWASCGATAAMPLLFSRALDLLIFLPADVVIPPPLDSLALHDHI